MASKKKKKRKKASLGTTELTESSKKKKTSHSSRSCFAPQQLRFTLSDSTLPLITTKKVHTKSIIHELLWFIRASTSTHDLSAAGVRIWDPNGSRSFLDSVGLNGYETGTLGPIYGFQWRHFGAPYQGPNHDYSGQGVDQLKNLIDAIINRPTDRRMILTAWNPAALHEMALPPCHMMCQFYVTLCVHHSSNAFPTWSNQLILTSFDFVDVDWKIDRMKNIPRPDYRRFSTNDPQISGSGCPSTSPRMHYWST
jgi:thymidylate synthase